MNKKIIRNIFLMLVVIFMSVQPVFASCYDYTTKAECVAGGSTCHWNGYACRDKSDWWGQAKQFYNRFTASQAVDTSAVESLVNIIKVVGNMVFVAATVIMGVKYIWGGIDSKASVKDGLMTLVVAACMFYGFSTIESIINPRGLFQSTIEDTATRIYSTILYVCNFLAIGGIVYIGVRYMLAGAEGRASLKAKGVVVVLGVIMVYATMTFLNLIVNTMLEIGG